MEEIPAYLGDRYLIKMVLFILKMGFRSFHEWF